MKLEKGQLFFKIRWQGYGAEDDTWIVEQNLNCPALIDEFVMTKGGDLLRVR
jgi:hypothetical protein